jgi:hypothetical protein
MEMEQTIQQLLANQAEMKADQARMEAKMNSNQENAETDRITDRECVEQMMARTDDSRERDREDLKRMMKEMDAKTDTNQAMATKQEEILAEKKRQNKMREDIKCGQAEMRSTLDEWLMDLKDGRKETTACNVVTETEPDPRMMHSVEEHQDIRKEEAVVVPVGEPRKWRRVSNLAAERHQKRKERAKGNRGSRRKSAAACRKVSRRAKVAWRKRNLFRKIRILEKCGL